eukprot:1158483-Pelagomonas_calceolata.AAC.14
MAEYVLAIQNSAFLGGTTAAGAICPSCLGQVHAQFQWQVKKKGCPMLFGKVIISNDTLDVLLFRPCRFLAAIAASGLTARVSLYHPI